MKTNSGLHYRIIEAGPVWSDKYQRFCQRAYQTYYPRSELGVTENLFSEEVFRQSDIKRYFNKLFQISEKQRVWLAIDKQNNILGGVAAHKYPEYCDMKAFYVDPAIQGHGIGRQLYERVLQFAKPLPIQVDVVNYMTTTINMYKKWGFKIDKTKGTLIYPWKNWPKEALEAYHAIYMVKRAT